MKFSKRVVIRVVMGILLFVLPWNTAHSQQALSSSLGLIVYPAKGQTEDEMNRAEGECFAWAKKQTGIDPFAVASAPPPEPGPAIGGGERIRGAVRGAAAGALIGSIAGDAKKGAGIGATAGVLAGGRQARINRETRRKQASQEKADRLQHFNKAFGVCLEGRGHLRSQVPGQRVSRRINPCLDATYWNATAEPALYGHHAGQKPRDTSRR